MTINALLLSSFADLHRMGGTIWMYPLSIMFAINIALVGYCLLTLIQKKSIHQQWLDTIKQVGGLAAAWGAFSTLIGLLYAFDAIEAEPKTIPLQVIAGGLKVALITVNYGLIILCVSLISCIVLRLLNRPVNA